MTAIQWTDVTWNPVRGCSRVSPGCENCYAERQAARPILSAPGKPYHGLVTVRSQASGLRHQSAGDAGPWTAPRWSGKVVLDAETLAAPLSWKKPRRVFVNSMSDMFHDSLTNEEIAAVYGVMAATPQHTYQILTKRAERMARWFEWVQSPRGCSVPALCLSCAEHKTNRDFPQMGPTWPRVDGPVEPGVSSAWPLRNVWLGVSVEDQQRADERIPHLLRCPADVRFLSVEPLIGPVDLRQVQHERDGFMRQSLDSIDWVIVGGESGPGARPCDVAWIRSIVQQCRAAGVPVFVKQLGTHVIANSVYDLGPDALRWWDSEHAGEPFPETGVRQIMRDRKGGDPSEWPEDLRVREWPKMTRAAVTAAFDHLDVHRAR